MSISIRRAEEKDFGAIHQLYALQDEHPGDLVSARWVMQELDPSKCVAWIALDGDLPVGFTAAFVRHVGWQGSCYRAAYWNNLFILPEYRQYMLYPRLPMEMFGWARKENLAFIFAPVRRRAVAKAHLAIGFVKCGEWSVMIKPLRPGRLIAKHKSLGKVVIQTVTPLDNLFGMFGRFKMKRRDRAVVSHPLTPSNGNGQSDAIVQLLNRSSESKAAFRWDKGRFVDRFIETPSEWRYRIAKVQDEKKGLVSAVIYCIAERGNQIKAAVIMDTIAQPGSSSAQRELLDSVAEDAWREGCELVICLDGIGGETSELMRRRGFRDSRERYDLLIWPANTPHFAWCSKVENWRFAFADHDAF